MKNYTCKDCGNTKQFIAEYRIYGQCIVAGDGTELEMNVCHSIDNKFIDNTMNTEIDKPCKCAICGSENIKEK